MQRRVEWRADQADDGERADVVLGRRIPGLSRRQARALGLAGRLHIDGRRCPPSTRVEVGQHLELGVDLPGRIIEPEARLEVEAVAITDDFVYVLKPAGVHTIALTPAQPGVLATAVVDRWPECGEASEDPREGGAVHRLDRPTSGVVAFARNRPAWQRARTAFKVGRVTKHYLAVCEPSEGFPTWPPALPPGALAGWIEVTAAMHEFPALHQVGSTASNPEWAPVRVRAPLGRADQARVAVRMDGRRASSVILPLAASTGGEGTRWLVRVRLETGVRHQARVHLAWIGLPIVGDLDYRGQGEHGPSLSIRLHAFVLDLSDVFSNEQAIVALPSSDFWPGLETT